MVFGFAMKKTVTLSAYVKKRTGVALGAPGSMKNMLSRSLGAGTFENFWRYWNPIWGYYLSRYVMKPLSAFTPIWFAIILTFAVSGALHDLAVMLLKWKFIFFFAPWFTLMGITVVVTKLLQVSYAKFPWTLRAIINVTFIVGSLGITYLLEHWWVSGRLTTV